MILRVVFAIICLGGGLHAFADDRDLPPADAVKPVLYATGFETAEGPALNEEGDLFVANYRGDGKIGRITAAGSASVWCELAKLAPVEGRAPRARGLKIDGEGRLIVADAGAGRLLRIAKDGARAEVLADRWEGKRFQAVNDVALDPVGNIYFTDHGEAAPEPMGAVYQYNINTKRILLLDAALAEPSGVAVTADSKHLYVAERLRERLLVYDLEQGKGATNRRQLIRFPQEDAGPIRGGDFRPEGMVFDQQGRLYVAMGKGGMINVVSTASGELLRQYDAGGEPVTNCHFHGEHLYTTVAGKEAVFRLKLGVKGLLYNRPQ